MLRTALLMAAIASAGASSPSSSPLTGTWIADLSTQSGLPKDIYLVAKGIYLCESCTPRRSYPADGRSRPVPGDPNVISESVTIVGPRTIVTRIVQRDLVRTTTMKVSRDGKSATYVSDDRKEGINGRLRTEYLARRVASGPQGSHAVSGTWQGVRYLKVPEQLRTTTLRDDGHQLTYRTGTGFSYTAPFGGKFEPILGPYDGTVAAAVERVDAHTVIETRRQHGQVIQVRTYKVARDRRTMEIATTNKVTNSTFLITARRKGTK